MTHPICAVCDQQSIKAPHAWKLIVECGFDGLPSDADLQDANPRVKDLRVKNRLGTVLCSKGGKKKNGFGDRRCYQQVRSQNPRAFRLTTCPCCPHSCRLLHPAFGFCRRR